MAALKCFSLLASCLIMATAAVADVTDGYVPVLSRQVRSPQDNNQVELKYQKDPRGQQTSAAVNYDGHGSSLVYREDKYDGRSAGAEYNKNLYTSKDGHVAFDAYAGANRNFDHNRNDVNAGTKGSIRW